MAVENLASVGMTLDSLSQEGQFLPLRKIESTEWGGTTEEATKIIHPDNVDITIRAAALFGLSTAGVDLMSVDISQPWHENGAVINEINFSPTFIAELSKPYRPIYIDRILSDDGRIPVEVFVGDDAALDIAKERQQKMTAEGVKCYLSSHELTLLPFGEQLILNTQSLFDRTIALLMNRTVEAILLVIQTDEFLHCGLPIDKIDKITVVNNEIKDWNNHNRASKTRYNELTRLLNEYTLPAQLN
jgi:cyanophycin synthetase